MLIIKLFAYFFFTILIASSAHASLLDFEGLTSESSVSLNSVGRNYGGFTWSPSFYLYHSTAFPAATHSGFYGLVNNDGKSAISVSSSMAFDFDGVWLGGWPVNTPSVITISGFDIANNVVNSVAHTLVEGNEIYVEANFLAVNRVEFLGGQYFSLDDFTFNTRRSNVPDPSSFFLLGVGILALAAVRRKSAAI